jgi:hypothetical protein
MTTSPRKLVLHRETIQTLSQGELGGVHGGTSPATTVVTIPTVAETVGTAGIASAAACDKIGNFVLNQAQGGFGGVKAGVKVAKAVGGGLVAGAKAIPGNIKDGLIGLATGGMH